MVDQVAVFESVSDFGFVGGTNLTFTLNQVFGGQHTIGRFRLSITTDPRTDYANGLASGGDVSANWIVLDPLTISSAGGAALTELGDFSILAGGLSPAIDVYTVTAFTSLTGITGVRLEVLEDPSLPFNGPGRQPTNGNFVLSELQVMATAAVPEPTSLGIWGAISLVAFGTSVYRRRAGKCEL
jgi:hypothetical protein